MEQELCRLKRQFKRIGKSKEVINMSGRLPPIPYKDFIDILKANGFKHDRSKGGHEVWEKTITDSVSIPVHGDINGGLARRLIREHGLKE